jgi:hypothetical protein
MPLQSLPGSIPVGQGSRVRFHPADATQREPGHPFKMASVRCQKDTVMSHHDPGDEAVGHANAHPVAFQGTANLGRRIGTHFVE